MLAGHLSDFVGPCPPDDGLAVLEGVPVLVASAEMQCAAWTNRLRLLRQELGQQRLVGYLHAAPVWAGAAAVAYGHPYRVWACRTFGQEPAGSTRYRD